MIIVGTSFTEGYAWANPYLASLKRCVPENSHIRKAVFSIGHRRPDALYLAAPGTRGSMAQHGSFLEYFAGNPTIVFTDADMLMQRPFTAEETLELMTVREGEVWLGRNLYDGQSLLEEAGMIEPKEGFLTLEELFPGWENMEVRNCGVIVARRHTYQRLYDLTRALLPACYLCFGGMAAIQWLICYCVQRWLKLEDLPRTMHVHGHVDPGPEVTFDEEGNAYVSGPGNPNKTMAVFRHAMNLDPSKNWETRRGNLTTDKTG